MSQSSCPIALRATRSLGQCKVDEHRSEERRVALPIYSVTLRQSTGHRPITHESNNVAIELSDCVARYEVARAMQSRRTQNQIGKASSRTRGHGVVRRER